MNLTDLPEELLIQILQWLSYQDIHLRIALVCKRFWSLTKSKIKLNHLLLTDLNSEKNTEFVETLFAIHCEVLCLTINLSWLEDVPGVLDSTLTEKDIVYLKILQPLNNVVAKEVRISGNVRVSNLDLIVNCLSKECFSNLTVLDLFHCKSMTIRNDGPDLDYKDLFSNSSKLKVVGLYVAPLGFVEAILIQCSRTLIALKIGSFIERKLELNWNLLWSCSKLAHVHLPYSVTLWNKLKTLPTLQSIEMDF